MLADEEMTIEGFTRNSNAGARTRPRRRFATM